MASLTLPTALFSATHQTTNRRRRVNTWAAGNGRRPSWTSLFHAAFTGDRGGSEQREAEVASREEADDVGSPSAISFSALTPEKARVLRREMRAKKIWRDAMYHSAIASRLASPDQA